MVVTASKEVIAQAAELLRSGEVVVFPTETVYGMGANALLDGACSKVFALKKRPLGNPLISHLPDVDQLLRYLPNGTSTAIRESLLKLAPLWPGPLTVVVPKGEALSSVATGGGSSMALRIPAHPLALELLRACDFPIAAPSANRSSYVSATRADHVSEQFGEAIPLIIDGGPCSVGIESTVLSLLEPAQPRVLRPGGTSIEKISSLLGVEVYTLASDSPSIEPYGEKARDISPGLLPLHYSPRTKVKFLRDTDIWSLPPIRVGLLSFREGQHLDFDWAAIECLSAHGNLTEVARNLFAGLYELDHAQLDLILVDSCEERGLGVAIMDRLRRATFPRD